MSVKGSRSRVKDQVTYGNNYDYIFQKKQPTIQSKIETEMDHLITWAKAYEEGDPMESDSAYDAQVRYLTTLKDTHQLAWKEALEAFPEFKDGSWAYTGSFYHGDVK